MTESIHKIALKLIHFWISFKVFSVFWSLECNFGTLAYSQGWNFAVKYLLEDEGTVSHCTWLQELGINISTKYPDTGDKIVRVGAHYRRPRFLEVRADNYCRAGALLTPTAFLMHCTDSCSPNVLLGHLCECCCPGEQGWSCPQASAKPILLILSCLFLGQLWISKEEKQTSKKLPRDSTTEPEEISWLFPTVAAPKYGHFQRLPLCWIPFPPPVFNLKYLFFPQPVKED